MARRQSLPTKSLRYLLGYGLTPLGRSTAALAAMSALGVITIDISIYQIFCGLAGLFLVVGLTGLLFQPSIQISGSLPDRISAGDSVSGIISIQNQGSFPACDLMCGFFRMPRGLKHANAGAVLPILFRQEEASLPVTIRAERRGEYVLPSLHVHSTFPLNLIRFGGASLPAGKLTVLPTFHRLEEFEIPLSNRYQHGGILAQSRSGDAPEYVGNRDYIPGEPVRRLDFRAWARVGRPVVREYQDEFGSRVALVLDTYQARTCSSWRQTTSPDIEAAVSLTASIADSLNQTEAAVNLFAAGPDLFLFQTLAGTTHFDSILEILAAVDTTRHNPFEKLSPVIAESLESTSITVCIFVDWDESREELTRRILESGCGLRSFLVRSEPPTSPFPEDDHSTWLRPEDILNGSIQRI